MDQKRLDSLACFLVASLFLSFSLSLSLSLSFLSSTFLSHFISDLRATNALLLHHHPRPTLLSSGSSRVLFDALSPTELQVLWEKARSSECPKKERAEHIAAIIELIKGKVHDIIFQHDSVRVLQCCMQYGNAEQRVLIFDEIFPSVLELSKSKYGKFMIPKLMTYVLSYDVCTFFLHTSVCLLPPLRLSLRVRAQYNISK